MMFLFKFCPHSVLSSYLFTCSHWRLFSYFLFLLQRYSSFLPFGHFCKRSGSAGSYWCWLANVSVVQLKNVLHCSMWLLSEKANPSNVFYTVFCSIFSTLVFSVSWRRFSSGTDVFSEAVHCGYYLSACQSSCPVKGFFYEAKELWWI